MTVRAHPLRTLEVADRHVALLPGQAEFYARLRHTADVAPVVACIGPHGLGRTTLLRRLADEIGALLIDVPSIKRWSRQYSNQRIDDHVRKVIEQGLERRGAVIFDGFAEFATVRRGSGRGNYFGAVMAQINDRVIRENKRLILGGNLERRLVGRHIFGSAAVQLAPIALEAEDYAVWFERRLGDRVAGVDFGLLHSLAPGLNLYQLDYLANRVRDDVAVDFERLLGLIEREIMSTNLRLKEVEALSFDSLLGSEHIAHALETHVVLPFEQPQLAYELDLKPRRGVLLYGPPGTGKTSIGRALAHRMQGRFFLIDGSFVTEPPSSFFAQIDAVVAQAKANSPCVLFIDDADVLFQIEHVAGLSRYLLSLLDGIESQTASRVCIMLTAMDPAKLPPALLRSGRVELWLETRALDVVTRAAIIARWLPTDMPGHDRIALEPLAEATEGFTPADLRRLTSDARLFYAADIAAGRPERDAQAYIEHAIAELGVLRGQMAARVAEDGARERLYA
jgi:transitional endoplasmic reticulum ATPase